MSVALKINAFGGMIPALDKRLLPDHNAASLTNAWLYDGRLRGTPTPSVLRALNDSSAEKVFRIPNNFTDAVHLSDSTWLEFDNPNTDVLRTNVVGDSFDRYYWASSTSQPMYNTTARIQAGNTSPNNPLLLGIPAPAVAPGVSPSGGVSSVTEARSYVYTWESAYGEEGPPSPPTVHTGKTDDTWAITMSAAATNDTNGVNRNIAYTNIYRTVTASDGTTTYFFVAQVAVGTLSYNDTNSDATVSANNELLSTNWTAPPTDLQGMVSMPNGMFVGWRQNEVWFCEPYRPHAWPGQYAVSVDYPVVGLGVNGNLLVICTEGMPYWGAGVNPAAFSLSKIESVEPCMARGSIVSAPEGVYYASPNGLVLVSHGTVVNVTRKMLTKDKWQNLVPLSSLRAVRLGVAYYAWGSAQQGVFDTNSFDTGTPSFATVDYSGSLQGILIDPTDERVAMTLLSNTDPVYNVVDDPWTGEVFLIRDGNVQWLNIGNQDPTFEAYTWYSKVFQTPNKRNLGALKIYFDTTDTLPALNPVPVVYSDYSTQPTLNSDQWGIVMLYADGDLVWAREIRTSGELMRLPSGLKADFWQFVIIARVPISNIQAAESARDLVKV